MSNSIIVIGAQWGDEGKGKIIDLLTRQSNAVVRFHGGHNEFTKETYDALRDYIFFMRHSGKRGSDRGTLTEAL